MKLSVAPMMPIGYKMKHRAMMVMVTAVVHPVEVLLEDMVVVVWQEEEEARLCVTTVTRLDIYLATVGTQLRHVGIAALSIM